MEPPRSLILLTYKGKVLLMYKNNSPIDTETHPWSLIGGICEKSESFEKALKRRVEKEAGIKIDNIELLSEYCYHAKLTDEHVNNIKRGDGQLLDFFSPKEINNLKLAEATAKFLQKHHSLIQ